MPGPDSSKFRLFPVILSGGSGSRLWPVSRRAHPKPFMKLADGQTMAEKTFRRANAISPGAPIMTVTSRDYFFYTRDLYADIGIKDVETPFLLEPMGRNTAPAIALAAHAIEAHYGPDAIMLVMPADHLIRDEATFHAAAREAGKLAAQGRLVTFGVNPTHPETGYGYIRKGSQVPDSLGFEVAAFVEKPDLETAVGYVDCGEYDWNSGMFCFRASAFLEALKRFAPEVADTARACFEAMDVSRHPFEIPGELFERCPSISIDYAVMERADNCAVVAGDFGWSDIGSWQAMADLYESDESGNSIVGKAVLVESSNCFVRGEDRLVAAVGVENLVVIDTKDAVLVADRERAQDVKEVVDQLGEIQPDAAVFHKTVYRPWGSYSILEESTECKVRRLTIKPGQVLSLQMHERRAEHWTVVGGGPKVTIGEKESVLAPNESVFIPAGTRHRLENPGQADVIVIEVQTGEYLGADDIVRYEDVYGTAGR